MDAVGLGFKVYLIEDADRGIDTPKGSLEERLDEMRATGVQIVQSNEPGSFGNEE